MDKVYQLHPKQTLSVNIEHPLFELCVSDKTCEELYNNIATRDVAMFNHIRWLVGRYVKYFPRTSRFIDDMVGQAAYALAECLSLPNMEYQKFLSFFDMKARYKIEQFLNDNRSMVSASLSTNKRAQKDKKDLFYSRDYSYRETDGKN